MWARCVARPPARRLFAEAGGVGLTRGLATGAAGALVLVLAAFGAGRREAAAVPQPRHPVLLTGADWAAYGPKEKEAYLSGFIAGAAAEQGRALAVTAGDSVDTGAVVTSEIARLRNGHQLRFSYAPSVYAAQIDDFYWWVDHRDTSIVDVMIMINRQMKDR